MYLFFGLGLASFVDYGHCFELVDAAEIPAVGVALADWFVGDERFGFVEGVALA